MPGRLIFPCPNKRDCPGTDFPITNYSSEGGEIGPPFVSVVYWAPGCVEPCTSYVSQEDADLCALRQAILCVAPPPPGCIPTPEVPCTPPEICPPGTICGPTETFFNGVGSCTVPCPDGTSFTFVTPAGLFVAPTQAEADAQAHAYACDRAILERICFSPLHKCVCVSEAYSAEIAVSEGETKLTWSITAGSVPPGMTFHGGYNEDGKVLLDGVPLISGNYSFTVRGTTLAGSYAEKTFEIFVIEITTSSLPAFTVGVAYSKQLVVNGGSGSYAFTITSGTLPLGLTMSLTGLISGTPLVGASGAVLNFSVVDTTCESTDRSFFPPRVTMTTVGTTIISTMRGWPEYQLSTGALYKRITPTGSFTQRGLTFANEFAGGAKWEYSGFSAIDIFGNLTSTHQKTVKVACDKQPFPEVFAIVPLTPATHTWTQLGNFNEFWGYCWTDDPSSCSTCDDDDSTWTNLGNYSSATPYDFPRQVITDVDNVTLTPTKYTYLGVAGTTFGLMLSRFDPDATGSGRFNPDGTPLEVVPHPSGSGAFVPVEGFPVTSRGTVWSTWFFPTSDGDWSIELSDPYTAADALASALIYSNNSKVAENLPNITTFFTGTIQNVTSRTTGVTYILQFSNLVVGESYVASVQLWDNGIMTVVPFAFTALAATHTISANIPTPAPNHKITVKNPSVAFA